MMDVDELIEGLEREGRLLVDAVERGDRDATVPTCPEWTLRDLARHTGGIHRWATRILRETPTEPFLGDLQDLAGGWPADEDLVPWLRAGHAMLVEALRSAPDDLQCWAFLAAPSPLAFWSRRQLHETTIHRVDAELASGAVTPPDPVLAADGIDELLTGFLPRPRSQLRSEEPRTIAIAADDAGASWRVRVSTEPPVTERGEAGEADVTVRGDAADLYLLVWNRGGLDRVKVEGDGSLLDVWRSDVQVRWS